MQDKSKLSMLLGIISLLTSCIFIGGPIGIIAILLGLKAYKDATVKSEKRNCTIGIGAGACSAWICIILIGSLTHSTPVEEHNTENYEHNTEVYEQVSSQTEEINITNNVTEANTEVVLDESQETTEIDNSETSVVTSESTSPEIEEPINPSATTYELAIADIPAYSSNAYVEINGNVPGFYELEYITESFEYYSELDSLGRCGVAYANIGQEIMPTTERTDISSIKPSGWDQEKYDVVEGSWLYNRCHIIGFQLGGDDSETNLITGTRYMNVEGMLPFENQVAEYVKTTNNHVLYRVTPIYADSNDLVPYGVQMEAASVEDNGTGISFNVFCYNIQPYIDINYNDGSSVQIGESSDIYESEYTTNDDFTMPSEAIIESSTTSDACDYVLNTNTKKFHYTYCSSVKRMSEKNTSYYTGTREDVINMGYDPCGNCNP